MYHVVGNDANSEKSQIREIMKEQFSKSDVFKITKLVNYGFHLRPLSKEGFLHI